MYGRVVIYTYDEDKKALEDKAARHPIVTTTPGYISYGVIFQDDRVISTSAWESGTRQGR